MTRTAMRMTAMRLAVAVALFPAGGALAAEAKRPSLACPQVITLAANKQHGPVRIIQACPMDLSAEAAAPIAAPLVAALGQEPRPSPRLAPPTSSPAPSAGWRSASPVAAAGSLLTVEAGTSLSTDRLDLTRTGGSGPLLGRSGGPVAMPRLRLELKPAAALAEGALRDLTLVADLGASVGLTTTADVAGVRQARGSRQSRLDLGVAWPVVVAGGLELTPGLGWAKREYVVARPFTGMPQTSVSGPGASLGAGWTLAPRVRVVARGGAFLWTDAGELARAGAGYAIGGRAAGLEAEAGVELAITPRMALRVTGEWAATTWSLTPDAAAAVQVSGAAESSLGLRTALRATY